MDNLDPKTKEAIERFTKMLDRMCQELGIDQMEEFIEELTPEILSNPELLVELFERIAGQDKFGEYGFGGDWWKAAGESDNE